MDYEKKYKEALERAKNLYKDAIDMGENIRAKQCEIIFPELKESEDEKIKKEIIQTLKKFAKCVEDGHDAPEAKDFLVKDTEKKIAWLEKQGKQEEPQVYETEDGEVIAYSETDGYKVVEPKFKVGDWITDGYLYNKITDVLEDRYIVDTKFAKRSSIPFKLENYYHLWTLQDAKDGDVLVYHNTATEIIMLFKSWVVDREAAYTHFHIFDNDFRVNNSCDCGNGAHPATKEQRDLLFEKMKEAGYEWDSEKKELKKIEQKHSCELNNSYIYVKFPFKAKVKSSGKIVTIHDGQLSCDGKEWIKYQSDAKDGYKVYEPNNLLELVCEIEQNPAWSKEDDKCLKLAIDNFQTLGNSFLTAWLKSLKDRIQSQPKQEWSEEDEILRLRTIGALETCKIGSPTKCVDEQINWLKSLRPQNVWISVDEEVYVKEPVLAQKKDKSDQFGGFVVCCDHTLTPNIYERYMILDNIVSQNTWKPSDEQMDELENEYLKSIPKY